MNPVEAKLAPPHGLDEIIATFGDIRNFIRNDGSLMEAWELNMKYVEVPFPLVLSWDTTKRITRFACHGRLAEIFAELLHQLHSSGLHASLVSFGGCFAYRPQRGSHKLSTHAWGISIDLNPSSNRMGTNGSMHSEVIDMFRMYGFFWGGDFTAKERRDPMHFQFCTGY